MSEISIDPAIFRQVLGTYPTGVSVITALDADGNPAGMVVGTFTSVSLDPPLVSVCIARCSATWPTLCELDRIGVGSTLPAGLVDRDLNGGRALMAGELLEQQHLTLGLGQTEHRHSRASRDR